MKNLLLIDSAVSDYQTFVDSVNSDTIPFVYRSSTTRQDLLVLIGEDTIDRIGIVFSHTPHFLEGLFFSDTNTDFFIDLIRRCEIKNLDFLACDTLRNPIWKTFYDKLHNETGVVVGASDNATGNIKYGGDWILESTSEDIENVYFTNKIEYYKYLLGADISMIVKTDGKIWASGYNGGLNLANGDMTYANKSSFIDITSLQSTEFQSKTVKLFKIGKLQGNFTFVLMTDGTLWGAGDSNRVGANTVINMFAKVPSFGTIVSFDCGSEYTVVHTTNNKLWGVGSNYYGQLGMPKSVNEMTTFTELSGITGTIKAFACGGYHTIVLTTSNKLWVTGFNGYGNLGTGDSVDKTSFTLVNLDTVSGKIPELIDCGVVSSFVSMTDGTIWKATYSAVFEQFSNGYNYYNGSRKPIKFALAYYHSAVLMSDGTVWGLGDPSLLGPDITTPEYNDFIPLTLPTTVRSIFLGMNYTIMLGTNNTLYATGMNDYGQFGNGSAPNSNAINTYVTSTTNVSLLAGDTVIVAVLSITSISQASNGIVTINGTKFTTPTVTMTGGFTSGTVTKVSDTQLTFTPSSFIGSSTFTVTDSGTSVSLTASFPSITSITQAATGLITINGTNFVSSTVTMTGGFTSGTVTRVSATQLTFTSSSYIGSSTFTVTDSDSSVSFTASFPTITSINQSANGFVTINGTNFVTPTVTMTGGFTSGTVTRVSATQLTFTSSSYIGSSTFTVTDSGNSVSLTVSFPSITSITQSANGIVTINGSNFTTSTVTMTGGFTSGTVTRVSATKLTFTPSSLIGSSTFTVTDSGNSVSLTASFPSISSITQAPNGMVTINGSNFTTSTVTMTGGFTSGTVARVSSSQLTFTPTPTMLTPPITFTLSDSGSSVTYIYSSNVPLPIITTFTPFSGTRNTLVTITGSNFGNVTSVLFGSVTATSPTITETTITVYAPINNKSVPITLISSGFSVLSSTNFTYNTNPSLFTSSTTDAYDKLLSHLSLTDGIADTGVLNLGSATTPINFSGPTYGVTMASSDNSSALATTAFVKSQGYSTGGSSVGYAQLAVAQTWSAIQTFSSGVQSSVYNALTATSNVSVGSNLTTGILNLGTSTSTVNLNVPLTPTYTAASLSGQVGYTVVLPQLDTVTYQFYGGDLVYRYVPIVQGTYVVTGAVTTTIALDYFNIHFSALKVTPAAGLETTNYAIPADRILAFAGLKASPLGTNVVLAGTTWSTTSTLYIPAGYTTLALVTNTYKGPSGNSPFSKINTTMSVTRIA